MSELDEALMSNPEFQAQLGQLKGMKEKIFALIMEIDNLAEDIGYPLKSELLEATAVIDEQLDVFDEMLNKYQGENDNG